MEWVKKGSARLQQNCAVYKSFGVRDKVSSLYRVDLHRWFGFPWLEQGLLYASNSDSLWLSPLPLSCIAGQTHDFDSNYCTSECMDIWHFPGTEPAIQSALCWAPVGLVPHLLPFPSVCGCLVWKGQSLQRVCLRRIEQFPALNPKRRRKEQINNKNPVSNAPLFPTSCCGILPT